MLAGCWSMLSMYLALASVFLSTGVLAAKKESGKIATKMGNSTIERTVQLRTHSIFPPYIDQDLQNRWWDFGGDAYVNTNKHVRLTQHKPSQMGWLWSRLALTAANWVIEVEFKVGGETSHLYGDGLALWITTERAQPGPIFGSKDYYNGLGIILDTYSNGRHDYGFPRIMGVQLDGQTKYDYGNDADSQTLGACAADFRRATVATKLRVTYVKDEFLDVKIQYKGWDDWKNCFSIPKIHLPPNPFIGFSAMTGDVSDAHDIISVSTYSAILSPPDAPRNQYETKKKTWLPGGGKASDSSSKSTWSGFFFKLFLFGGACAGAWYGYQEYQRRQRFNLDGFGSYGGKSPMSGRSFGSPSTAGFGSSYTPSTAGYHNGPNTGGLYAPTPTTAGGAYSPTAGGFGGPNSAYSNPPPSAGFGRSTSPYSAPPSGGFGGPPSAGPGYSYAETKRY